MFDLASRSALGTAHASTLVVQDTLDDLRSNEVRSLRFSRQSVLMALDPLASLLWHRS